MMYKRRLADVIEEADDLYICRIIPHPTLSMVIQALCSAILLYIGSERLVDSVKELALHTGISEMGLALVIVPAATAIPETASALIWGYRGRDTLSIGALVGEKILYSTFYPGLGLLLTSWVLDSHAYMSVVATTVISLVLLYYIAKQRVPVHALCFGLIFFVGYVILVFILHI
jgi:cation:H+ antiporter